jgi:transcriptional regulator with XRE-family HTH domain
MIKNIGDIRRENLREIISRQPSQKAVAIKAGINPAYLSQVLSCNKRRPGKKTCRAIEAAYKLPIGWLDKDRNIISKLSINKQNKNLIVHEFSMLTHCLLISKSTENSKNISKLFNPDEEFGVKICTNTYYPDLIKGDILVFDKSRKPLDNCLALFFTNNTPSLRRYCVKSTNTQPYAVASRLIREIY